MVVMNQTGANSPLVSVVIPTFNRSRKLIRAIKSCQTQTYTNIEIIVCDDHSTDNTVQLVENLIKNDSRIVLCHTKKNHKGANAARNEGILNAKGMYLCFLDSDDELTENSIQDRVHVLEQNPQTGMVYGNAICVMANKKTPWKYDDLINVDKEQYLLHELALCITSSIMIRRKPFAVFREFDESSLAWNEDELTVSVGLNYEIRHCHSYVCLIHKSKASITSNNYNKYCGLKNHFKKFEIEIKERTSILNYLLWKVRLVHALVKYKEEDINNLVIKYFLMVGRLKLEQIIYKKYKINFM